MSKLMHLLKKSDGYSTINVIICVLIILLTFSLLMEITLVGQRYSYMAQTTSYVARVMGEQGGISNSIPSGYGDPPSYTKSSTLYNTLANGFSEAGFDEWNVRINGSLFRSTSNLRISEKEEIRISIQAGFYPIFDFMGNSDNIVTINTNRITYSSFTPRHGGINLIK